MPSPETSSSPRSKAVLLLRLLLLAGVLVALSFGGMGLVDTMESSLKSLDAYLGGAFVYLAVALYILLMAIPFVPGMEVGMVLMMMFGVEGVLIVYFSTLMALLLSFCVGRFIPLPVIAWLLGRMRMHSAEQFVLQLAPLSPEDKLELLVRLAPARVIPYLLRHRYVAVGLAFNIPGNSLVGGGGGIGLMAGVSGLFSIPRYALMVAIAISPIPLVLLARSALPWFAE